MHFIIGLVLIAVFLPAIIRLIGFVIMLLPIIVVIGLIILLANQAQNPTPAAAIQHTAVPTNPGRPNADDYVKHYAPH